MACMVGPEVDQMTADLIVQLQLQDVGVYSESSKGKSREPTDEEMAFHIQHEELENISHFFEDRRMAMSFATAVVADGLIVAQAQAEEENASKDRDIACHLELNGKKVFPFKDAELVTTGLNDGLDDSLDDETLAKLQMAYVSGLQEYHKICASDINCEQAESSVWAARRTYQSQSHQCVACREEIQFVDVARVPCQHEYCRTCLEDLFKASMADESLFPPRCCRQPINLSVARIFLKSKLVQDFEKKKIEFETANRTYCYNSDCASFVDPRHIDSEIATCPNCRHTTCTNCKGRAHTGDCPNDIAMHQLLSTAQENGWQRCYSCWRLVELDHGCNHMICRCGAQFCYNCGVAWKECACEQWNEHRLLARAYQIIDRDAAYQHADALPPDLNEHLPEEQGTPDSSGTRMESQAMPLGEGESMDLNSQAQDLSYDPTPRDILVARTIEELRENHECGHNRWKYVRGARRCEECSHFLPEYIFECRQCRLQACNRCRRNRL